MTGLLCLPSIGNEDLSLVYLCLAVGDLPAPGPRFPLSVQACMGRDVGIGRAHTHAMHVLVLRGRLTQGKEP